MALRAVRKNSPGSVSAAAETATSPSQSKESVPRRVGRHPASLAGTPFPLILATYSGESDRRSQKKARKSQKEAAKKSAKG